MLVKNLARIALLAICFSISACGGGSRTLATPSVVHAATNFPPATPLICVGQTTDPAGQICDISIWQNGSPVYYHHWHTSVTVRPDGHGTLSVITESGVQVAGTYELTVKLPQVINLAETHTTLNAVSFCANNGLFTKWDGAAVPGTVEHLSAAKGLTLNLNDQLNFADPQIVFPVPVPVSELYLYINNDLCSVSTVNWTFNGSF